MGKNIGSTEKIIRIVIAIIAFIVAYFAGLSPTLSYIAYGVGALALITGLINFCPLWAVLGVKTNK